MKIYELKKGDRFKAEFHNPKTDEVELTITGIFIGMDGLYAKCLLDGFDDYAKYSFDTEVIKVNDEKTNKMD